MIRWCPPIHTSQLLLSTNDKTIKLWKVYNHYVHTLRGLNSEASDERSNRDSIRVPRIAKTDTVPACSLKSLFRDGHSYHINSISLCSDGETFISADDLRINMWNLSIPHISFNILDMKPSHMEDLTEVITSTQFHPTQCNQLMFSSSRGVLRLMDLRQRAVLSNPDCVLEQEPDPNDRSFFSAIHFAG
jgi:serine/threonine-protein phosphatase 2A regulatory subunit B